MKFTIKREAFVCCVRLTDLSYIPYLITWSISFGKLTSSWHVGLHIYTWHNFNMDSWFPSHKVFFCPVMSNYRSSIGNTVMDSRLMPILGPTEILLPTLPCTTLSAQQTFDASTSWSKTEVNTPEVSGRPLIYLISTSSFGTMMHSRWLSRPRPILALSDIHFAFPLHACETSGV